MTKDYAVLLILATLTGWQLNLLHKAVLRLIRIRRERAQLRRQITEQLLALKALYQDSAFLREHHLHPTPDVTSFQASSGMVKDEFCAQATWEEAGKKNHCVAVFAESADEATKRLVAYLHGFWDPTDV